MNVTLENIKITNLLVGFHSFTKDHNFPTFKGNMINDISKELNITLDQFEVGAESLLKSLDKHPDFFEIRLAPKALIYKDDLSLELFVKNALLLLGIWRKYTSLINLRLIGIVRIFELNIEQTRNKKELQIQKSFFKSQRMWDEIVSGDYSLKFNTMLDSNLYNINIKLTETTEKDYHLNGLIDFNQTSKDVENCFKDGDIIRIFDRAKKYFEKEFLTYLNK